MSGPAPGPNAEQAEYWSSAPGRKWIDHEAMLDTLLAGVDALLVERAAPRPGERVLEIGCGTGATTRALAVRVGQGGHVLAVDISAPLLDRARTRAADLPQAEFLLADAQAHGFEPRAADLVASRFGVMFFADPVAAFRNIRRALAPGGRLCMAAWADMAANPWFRIPRDAAVARLGKPEPALPTAPGPLAFADRGRVCGILSDAGFATVEASAEPVELSWPGEVGPLATLATNLGPATRILRERGGTAEDEAAIRATIAAALAGFRAPDGFRVPATINLFTARAP